MVNSGLCKWLSGAACLLLLGGASHGAPPNRPPEAYTIVEHNVMGNAPETVTINRDGKRVMTDTVVPPIVSARAKLPHGAHVRAVYDLQANRDWQWDPSDASIPCTAGSGSWGNPFEWVSQIFGDDLSPFQPRTIGADSIAGRKAKVLELTPPGSKSQKDKVEIWLDAENGLLLKMAGPGESGKQEIGLEVLRVSLAKPPASLFAVPARCPK